MGLGACGSVVFIDWLSVLCDCDGIELFESWLSVLRDCNGICWRRSVDR